VPSNVRRDIVVGVGSVDPSRGFDTDLILSLVRRKRLLCGDGRRWRSPRVWRTLTTTTSYLADTRLVVGERFFRVAHVNGVDSSSEITRLATFVISDGVKVGRLLGRRSGGATAAVTSPRSRQGVLTPWHLLRRPTILAKFLERRSVDRRGKATSYKFSRCRRRAFTSGTSAPR